MDVPQQLGVKCLEVGVIHTILTGAFDLSVLLVEVNLFLGLKIYLHFTRGLQSCKVFGQGDGCSSNMNKALIYCVL